jgi:hypothetical protein
MPIRYGSSSRENIRYSPARHRLDIPSHLIHQPRHAFSSSCIYPDNNDSFFFFFGIFEQYFRKIIYFVHIQFIPGSYKVCRQEGVPGESVKDGGGSSISSFHHVECSIRFSRTETSISPNMVVIPASVEMTKGGYFSKV